ncbi:S-layer homology domain-containing protein [Stenomitos frigidus]|uniref:S-layer homology domain-containing protein n=1 Tax=Stenomitos frigidus ULC18 TaxID=2107698 RepID=A0A2T1E5R4_9CYAN|nr:S-layer homology domain-containing protein [Stenomitos frigidus]PSB28092.1 S-layer homology domain-containing protein [Stenomitos frigidus ULC18]
MSHVRPWSSTGAVLLALGVTSSAIAPFVVSAPASAANFSDTRSHWARPFIDTLADRQIIAGFPDGTFKPDAPVTRAQFAAIVKNAFSNSAVRVSRGFGDVPNSYWAATAIGKAYETGFMSGYPDGAFKPEQQIPKVQVLVALSSGLNFAPARAADTTLATFRDGGEIPAYAKSGVAAAAERNVVVNYPNVSFLNPNETATRADVAAYIYQTLVNQGKLAPIAASEGANNYIARLNGSTPTTGSNPTPTNNQTALNPRYLVPQGTSFSIRYLGSQKIVVTPGETINNLTLRVVDDLKNPQGQVVVPRDSEIVGQLIPVTSNGQVLGTQFIAQRVTIGSQSYPFSARSQVVSGQPVTQNTSPGSLKDAATSAATSAVLATILGQKIDLGTILAGATGGQATPQSQTPQNVILIDPSADLRLTVSNDFYANP